MPTNTPNLDTAAIDTIAAILNDTGEDGWGADELDAIAAVLRSVRQTERTTEGPWEGADQFVLHGASLTWDGPQQRYVVPVEGL